MTRCPKMSKHVETHLRTQFLGGGGQKETNKLKTHKHFRSNRPRDEPPPVPGTKRDKIAILPWNSREEGRFLPGTGPNLSRGEVPFVPETVPVCPGHRPAQNVHVYFFLAQILDNFQTIFANLVTWTKMFMFLGFRTQHINIDPWPPGRETTPSPRQSPDKIVYAHVPFPE